MKETTLRTALAIYMAMLATAPAAASEQDDVMKTVRQWVDGLNSGDTKAALAACAEETAIVDEFAPYEWHGKGTCAKWLTELAAFNKGIGLTDGVVTLKQARRVDVTGDRAYVVVPADFRFKENGRDGAEIGALFTVALHKGQAGWRIKGWAWSRP
jgi:ketosteroid isomerase-like protein